MKAELNPVVQNCWEHAAELKLLAEAVDIRDNTGMQSAEEQIAGYLPAAGHDRKNAAAVQTSVHNDYMDDNCAGIQHRSDPKEKDFR